MGLILINIPVASVLVDEEKYPDLDRSMIVEHLIRYCSKFDPLPAIGIALHEGAAVLVHGHKYLLAARALGRPAIPALVKGDPSPEQLHSVLATTGAMALDLEAIRAVEDRDPTPRVWQLFYFVRPLSSVQKSAFESAIRCLFPDDEEIQFMHDDTGPLVEFEARVPVTDERWARRRLDTLCTFHEEHVPIVSSQGGRFGG